MPTRLMLLLCAALLLCATKSIAADPPEQAFMLFPVRTQLQKEVLFDKHERYYLLINGDQVIDADGKLDSARLDFSQMSQGISNWRRPGDCVRALTVYSRESNGVAGLLLSMAVQGWAAEKDFARYPPSTASGDRDWQSATRLLGKSRGVIEEQAAEDGLGDETVKVFPVRTKLSRLMSSDDTNCVVWFPRPFDKAATGVLDEAAQTKLKGLVESLKLKEQNRVEFAIRLADDANPEAVETFGKKTAKELNEALGFKSYVIFKTHR